MSGAAAAAPAATFGGLTTRGDDQGSQPHPEVAVDGACHGAVLLPHEALDVGVVHVQGSGLLRALEARRRPGVWPAVGPPLQAAGDLSEVRIGVRTRDYRCACG
eukprot:CAMPEP_0175589188 /NCGR_PEP_ID=MMETSP0096-20121207/51681_1 /TAXON_ID=311494 /ORGANISM="Alexandrium monilatum, Strain CCMP3105" /LENGTH=103 /DNA_ID=CAMNT_0016893199 /DNA_START=41 /DNA_END=350 /DNA_ORIENTATION=-